MAPTFLPEGTITTPGGLRATGIHIGLKSTRDRDLGLLIAKGACTAAVHMGASSGVTGAWSTANVRRNPADIRAVLVLTGADGGRGAEAVATCDRLAALLADEAVIKPQNIVLLASGPASPFDEDVLRRGVPRSLDELDSKGGRRLALALDEDGQIPAQAAVEVRFAGDKPVLLGGLFRAGASPRLLITTNAAVPAALIQKALDALLAQHPELDQSGIVALASGSADAPACARANDAQFKAWRAGLLALAERLLAPPA
ncbi:MAG TPA: hypothetical protein VD886_19765 [Herpetosiphonaceae bacterium]|nr:hypothetical protein [Herpetosiphonaceae bacterium]